MPAKTPYSIVLPNDPMTPILDETIPEGDDWGYQLKWDGVRILAKVENGNVELFSRQLLRKNSTFPELVKELSTWKGRYLLDGEAVVFDPVKQRPDFQQVLIRERTKAAASMNQAVSTRPVAYVLFDLLYYGDADIRSRPYSERYDRLKNICPERSPTLFVTDLFPNGKALWEWVKQHEWEGIVSKRLSSPYREGKKHKDWLKKKTAIHLEVSIVGITIKDGRISSLVMVRNGFYFGKISLGLNVALKQQLAELPLMKVKSGTAEKANSSGPFAKLPPDLKGDRIHWLSNPFPAAVTGLEITSAGLLRHPKIIKLNL